MINTHLEYLEALAELNRIKLTITYTPSRRRPHSWWCIEAESFRDNLLYTKTDVHQRLSVVCVLAINELTEQGAKLPEVANAEQFNSVYAKRVAAEREARTAAKVAELQEAFRNGGEGNEFYKQLKTEGEVNK